MCAGVTALFDICPYVRREHKPQYLRVNVPSSGDIAPGLGTRCYSISLNQSVKSEMIGPIPELELLK